MAPLPYSNCVFSDGKSNWAVLKHALQDQHWLMQNNPWNKPILYSRSPQLVFYIMLKKNEMQKNTNMSWQMFISGEHDPLANDSPVLMSILLQNPSPPPKKN